jgi:hypothetical protein
LDATHFRQRAARAREMAQSGDDLRLSRMLLEVALDLDAEAESMESGGPAERRSYQRVQESEISGALLHLVGSDADASEVWIIDLSVGGARFRVGRTLMPSSRVILEMPSHALRLYGTVSRVQGAEAVMVFDPASSADPGLSRLLKSEARTNRVQA